MGEKVETGFYQFLRNVSFFEELPDTDIRNMLKYCGEEQFSAGEILFHENDPADRFYIVLQGEVEVWKAYGTDDADMLAVHGKGHLFGEMALIDDMPRSATVLARRPTRLLYIKEEDFQRMVRENSSVGFSIIKSLSSMVRKSNDTFLEDLKARNQKLEEAYRELKTAQDELLRKDRLSNLGKFSSMILHDLRNPISTLKSYAEMILMNEEITGKPQEYVKNILHEADRLNNLANEFLDYSRGEIRLTMNIVLLKDFMEKLNSVIRRRFASRNTEITIESRFNEPVIFDHDRMLRVLLNLAENGRKAMGREGMFSIIAEKQRDALLFIITDTGDGMTPEVLEHIFEPFYSSSQGGGTGLGMVIVKNIVDAHEGSLKVESAPGKGTKVTISLPLRG
jgi:signal transduction histidine kinase